MDVAIYPGLEGQKVSQVDSLGERTFTVSLELPIKAVYGIRKLHKRHHHDERFPWEDSQRYSAKNQISGRIQASLCEINGIWAFWGDMFGGFGGRQG